MNYDEINKFMTEHPWFTIAMTFVVVGLCIAVLFMNYGNKVDTDQNAVKVAAMVQQQKKAQTLELHQAIGIQKFRQIQKPLLQSLTLAQCPSQGTETRTFLPLCARCNVPLVSVDGRQLFKCPVCKQQMHVRCPGGTVASLLQEPLPARADSPGSYVCPVCKRQAMPNWGPNGAPLCPYCNNIMGLY